MPDIDFFEITDAGTVREQNEDAIAHWPHADGLAFAVADGVGGHAAGEIASALAIEVLGREMASAPASWPVGKRLRRAVQEANLELHQKALVVPELSGMATTLTATVLSGGTLVAAHVGDSRLFLFRDGAVEQLTKDHTWVAEQVAYGLMSAAAAKNHPRRSHLTRCLGKDLIVGIDVLSLDVRPGDVLVQCSDGVHGVLEPPTIAELVAGAPAADACRALLERALEAGSADNCSVQVATIVDCPAPAPRPWWRRGR